MRLAPLPPETVAALVQFRAFHAELVAVKEMLASPALAAPAAEDGPPGPALPLREAFARLYRKLAELGHGQARGAARSRLGDTETGYVLAALADETVLQRLDEPGRDAWAPMLLEDALYGSRIAGERVFELAAAGAEGRLPGRPDLAVTLLLALLAGFRGRYRDLDDAGAVQALCLRLYERVNEQPWLRDIPWRPVLTPPEEDSLAPTALRRLPGLRPWLAALAAVVLLYVAAAHWIWRSEVAETLALADLIVERPLPAERAGP